jgi:Methyltransferase FkbM domain
MFTRLKSLLPNRPVPMRIWRGPLRGARIVMNPRSSLRKAFGLYEHELNGWLEQALHRVTRLLDVGANDGYFTFGCAAAFRRRGVVGEIICFEPQAPHVQMLRESIAAQGAPDVRFEVVHALVGHEMGAGMTTLDALLTSDRKHTLIKIDVEGAELDVIAGAQSWMNASNLFVIEVHKEEYLDKLQRGFSTHGLKLMQINQRPLPLLGREERDEANWWLVSELGATV